jgi:hypothetical protein
MIWRVVGLVLVMAGAVVTFAGKAFVEKIWKKELLQREVLLIKAVGAAIVIAGAILVFNFGGN